MRLARKWLSNSMPWPFPCLFGKKCTVASGNVSILHYRTKLEHWIDCVCDITGCGHKFWPKHHKHNIVKDITSHTRVIPLPSLFLATTLCLSPNFQYNNKTSNISRTSMQNAAKALYHKWLLKINRISSQLKLLQKLLFLLLSMKYRSYVPVKNGLYEVPSFSVVF